VQPVLPVRQLVTIIRSLPEAYGIHDSFDLPSRLFSLLEKFLPTFATNRGTPNSRPFHPFVININFVVLRDCTCAHCSWVLSHLSDLVHLLPLLGGRQYSTRNISQITRKYDPSLYSLSSLGEVVSLISPLRCDRKARGILLQVQHQVLSHHSPLSCLDLSSKALGGAAVR
jgi:hypothetical protein